jgi:hypothetical protein
MTVFLIYRSALKENITMSIKFSQISRVILLATSATALILSATIADARIQRGYIKKNGTYVSPHQKNNPDGKRYNNRGSQTNGGKQRDEFSNHPAYNKSRNK